LPYFFEKSSADKILNLQLLALLDFFYADIVIFSLTKTVVEIKVFWSCDSREGISQNLVRSFYPPEPKPMENSSMAAFLR